MNGPPLFLLAVDHRRSFERLFGVERPADERAHRRLAAAKVLVIDAVTSVAAAHPGRRGLGVLLDDQYGTDAIAAAHRSGLTIATAFERSGLDVLEFEHDDWRGRLADLDRRARSQPTAGPTNPSDPSDPSDYAKVLVRHRADGDDASNAVQLERLGEISDACAESAAGFLLELLVPFSASERSSLDAAELETSLRSQLIVGAIAQIQAAGVQPDVWKVEGVADAGQCSVISAQARVDGRDDVGVVVLGAGADDDTVHTWMRSAAAGGYSGFAVGRSIWADALVAHDAGNIDAETARARIASKYVTFLDVFEAVTPA